MCIVHASLFYLHAVCFTFFVMFTRSGWDCFVQHRNPVGQNAGRDSREITRRFPEQESNYRFGKVVADLNVSWSIHFYSCPHTPFFFALYLLTKNKNNLIIIFSFRSKENSIPQC